MTPSIDEAQTAPLLTVSRDVALADDPIEPSWVLTGEPRASSHQWAISADAAASVHVWECTAGRFKWYFAVDETVTIIDGSVTVSTDETPSVRLEVGDAAYFRAGTWSVWDVETVVRKIAVLRVPVPGPLARVVRGLGGRLHRLR